MNVNREKVRTDDWRSEMNPELAGSWRSTAFEGYRRSPAENVDQDPTYARAVLKPRDPNRDFGHDVYSTSERVVKCNIPKTKSRKRTVKESCTHHASARNKCITEIGEDEWKLAASENYIGQYAEELKDVDESEANSVPVTEYVNQNNGPTYAGAVLELRVVNRNLDRDVSVPAPARVRKPRFTKIKSRKQKKQSKPRKEEPTYATGEGPPLALESLQKPREHRTCFAESADEFALSKECCAMMGHLDLNRRFERMPYTLMLRK